MRVLTFYIWPQALRFTLLSIMFTIQYDFGIIHEQQHMPLISELGKQRQADLWELKEASKFYRASSRTARAIVRPCRYDLGIMFMIYL